MKKFISLTLKGGVLIALGVIFTLGLLLETQPQPSWAAPNQHPDQQSVPPRRPTATPFPPSNNSSSDKDDGNVAQPGAPGVAPTEEIPFASPTAETDNAQLLTPTPEPTSKADDAANLSAEDAPAVSDSATPPDNGTVMADLSLRKIVDNKIPHVGEQVTFAVVIKNSGPANAQNIIVRDSLPEGLTLESVKPGGGIYNERTGEWVVDALNSGDSVSLTVVGVVEKMGIITNTAEIIAAFQPDPDSTPDNGRTDEDDLSQVTLIAYADTYAQDQVNRAADIAQFAVSGDPLKDIVGIGSLYWLYALVLGIILTLVGLFLVKRA